jgi:inorganic pyrophosphatase
MIVRSIYKIPDGKPENTFAFSGEAKNKKYATEIIHECHEAWRRLITGESPMQELSMYALNLRLSFTCLTSVTATTSPSRTRLDSSSGTIRCTPIFLLTRGSRLPPSTLLVRTFK